MYIRVFHFYTFVQFRLVLCVSWLQHYMYATTKNISVLAYAEVPVTGHGVLNWSWCLYVYIYVGMFRID